jgi:hypothetical protein
MTSQRYCWYIVWCCETAVAILLVWRAAFSGGSPPQFTECNSGWPLVLNKGGILAKNGQSGASGMNPPKFLSDSGISLVSSQLESGSTCDNIEEVLSPFGLGGRFLGRQYCNWRQNLKHEKKKLFSVTFSPTPCWLYGPGNIAFYNSFFLSVLKVLNPFVGHTTWFVLGHLVAARFNIYYSHRLWCTV